MTAPGFLATEPDGGTQDFVRRADPVPCCRDAVAAEPRRLRCGGVSGFAQGVGLPEWSDARDGEAAGKACNRQCTDAEFAHGFERDMHQPVAGKVPWRGSVRRRMIQIPGCFGGLRAFSNNAGQTLDEGSRAGERVVGCCRLRDRRDGERSTELSADQVGSGFSGLLLRTSRCKFRSLQFRKT